MLANLENGSCFFVVVVAATKVLKNEMIFYPSLEIELAVNRNESIDKKKSILFIDAY